MSVEATDTGSGEMALGKRGPEDRSFPIRIFISYRREDTRWAAGRIYDGLEKYFGKSNVFKDIDTIEPGSPFGPAIQRAIGRCDLLLAVIGREWLTLADTRGQRRLDDPKDWHRRELETAIDQGKALFAVLVDGAGMPVEEELPGRLKSLVEYQSFIIGEPFEFFLQGLIRGIEAVARRKAEEEQAERELAAEGEQIAAEQAAAEQAVAKAEREHAAERARIAAERAAAAKAAKAQAAGDKAAEGERVAAERERAEREEREKVEREEAEPEQVGPPSLREAVDQANLKCQVLPDGTLAFPFRSERTAGLLILARALSDEIVLFSVRLPKPGMFGQEAGLRNLLRASFQANYTKVMASASLDLMAASELHPSMLTPGVAEGLIRGLASLGDLRSGDLRDWQTMTAAIRSSRGTQESHIVVDPDAAREAIRRMAEEDGLAVQESAGVMVFEFPLLGLEGSHLKLLVNASSQVISIGAFLGMKPQGNKVQFMQQLLQLNQVADVARVGLDADDEVAFLYEVPVVTPGLLERVKTQFMLLSVGVAAIAAGDLRRRS